jgi:peptidoglycan/LPS O-acetylase OafA/YrhL
VERNVFTAPFLALALNTGISVGTLGICLFFLISGFVILRAVERESPKVFLIRRVFRIYPVSIACVAVSAIAVAWYCAATYTVSSNTLGSVLASALVLNGPTRTFPTVPVMWSLEVELIFYCFMAGLAASGRLGFKAILALCLACMAFTLTVNAPGLRPWIAPALLKVLGHISFSTLQMPYLLVGAMLYRTATDGWSMRGAAYCTAALGVFLATRGGYLWLRADPGGVDLANGLWALAIFAFALWSGMRWQWIAPLRWVADISYPLYLVHAPLAWVTLAVLAARGWGMLEAGIAAGLAVTLVAWLIHLAIETPARKFGAAIASRHRQVAHVGLARPARF